MRESCKQRYDRALQRVGWASDTTMSFPIVHDGLTETYTCVNEVIGLIRSLESYGVEKVTIRASSCLTIYGHRHLASVLMDMCERLAHFDLKFLDELAHKVDIDFFCHTADKTYLAYTLGGNFM